MGGKCPSDGEKDDHTGNGWIEILTDLNKGDGSVKDCIKQLYGV